MAIKQGFLVVHDSVWPGIHVPAPSQISSPLQMLLSEQDVPSGLGDVVHPIAVSQVAMRHGLLVEHASDAPGIHVPAPSQISSPLHTLPSEHVAPSCFGVVVHPIAGSQTAFRHGFSVEHASSDEHVLLSKGASCTLPFEARVMFLPKNAPMWGRLLDPSEMFASGATTVP